jgi:hypothetical protein
MAELQDAVAAPDTTALPGYTLTPIRTMHLAELRQHFEAYHFRVCQMAADGMTPRSAERFMADAHKQISRGLFAEWGAAFKIAMLASGNLPKLLQVTIREQKGHMPLEWCEAQITDANHDAVADALHRLAGFIPAKKNTGDSGGATTTNQTPTPPPTGSGSSQASEPTILGVVDSPPPKSAA